MKKHQLIDSRGTYIINKIRLDSVRENLGFKTSIISYVRSVATSENE